MVGFHSVTGFGKCRLGGGVHDGECILMVDDLYSRLLRIGGRDFVCARVGDLGGTHI